MQKRRHIQQILVRSIALTVLATLAVAVVVSVVVLSDQSKQRVSEVLSQSLDDILSSSEYATYGKMMEVVYDSLYNNEGEYAPDDAVLQEVVASEGLTTFDVLDKGGTIIHSFQPL